MMTLTEAQIAERTKEFGCPSEVRRLFLMAKAYKAKGTQFALNFVAKRQFTMKLEYNLASYVYETTGILFEVA